MQKNLQGIKPKRCRVLSCGLSSYRKIQVKHQPTDQKNSVFSLFENHTSEVENQTVGMNHSTSTQRKERAEQVCCHQHSLSLSSATWRQFFVVTHSPPWHCSQWKKSVLPFLVRGKGLLAGENNVFKVKNRTLKKWMQCKKLPFV